MKPRVETIDGVRYLIVGADRFALSDADVERLISGLVR